MHELNYPFDGNEILKKRKSLRRRLLDSGDGRYRLRIAILGGSTTDLIKDVLELFLLNERIEPVFYMGGYGRYYEEAVFDNGPLRQFQPDLILFHTGTVNIIHWPEPTMDESEVEALAAKQMERLEYMWRKAKEYGCQIIQNNFEMPCIRYLGNMDSVVASGRTRYILKLNWKMAEYARDHEGFDIHDICYLSAQCGLNRWYDPSQWYQAHLCPGTTAVSDYCYSAARMISSMFLGSKKVIVTDLDDTLWAGTVAESGPDDLNMAPGDAIGEAHLDYQRWLLEMRKRGIILSVATKNHKRDALAGLSLNECLIKPEMLGALKAGWGSKDVSVKNIAKDLNIFPDSIVFIDNSNVERKLVRENVPGVLAPDFEGIENLLPVLSASQLFQTGKMTQEDLRRADYYSKNVQFEQLGRHDDYEDFLRSLDMKLFVGPVKKSGLARMSQLLVKTHRFHFTKEVFYEAALEKLFFLEDYWLLGGELQDCLGSNGMISYMICRRFGNALELLQWVMSCRVFERGVEHAMIEYLVSRCRRECISEIWAYYDPTPKNSNVAELLFQYGFQKTDIADNARCTFILKMEDYVSAPCHIQIKQSGRETV